MAISVNAAAQGTKRDLAVFAGLFVPVFLLAPYADFLWFRTFISDRSFGPSYPWMSWPMLLSWIPYVVIFGVSGVILAIFLRTAKPAYWALSFGALYSLGWFLMSSHRFEGGASLADYFWVYARYLVPSLSCACAMLYARHHASQSVRNPGPYP